MIEQIIEQKVADGIAGALSEIGVSDFQIATQLGALDENNGVKGLEDSSGVIATVKSSPRSYSTATIPTCQIGVEANVIVRADVDWNGTTYKGVTGAVMDIFERWQKCYPQTHSDFSVDGKFRCVGYQLDDGEFALDQSGKFWTYRHSMTIYGVILGD